MLVTMGDIGVSQSAVSTPSGSRGSAKSR